MPMIFGVSSSSNRSPFTEMRGYLVPAGSPSWKASLLISMQGSAYPFRPPIILCLYIHCIVDHDCSGFPTFECEAFDESIDQWFALRSPSSRPSMPATALEEVEQQMRVWQRIICFRYSSLYASSTDFIPEGATANHSPPRITLLMGCVTQVSLFSGFHHIQRGQ